MKLLIVLLVIFFVEINSKSFPSYITLCKRNDPDLSGCVLKNIEKCKPYLKEGIPKLRVPAMDPLKVSKIGLKNGDLAINIKSLNLYNLNEFTIHKIHVELDTHHVDIDLSFPYLEGSGTYEIIGRLLLLDLNGSGTMRGNITNLNVVLDLNGKMQPDGHVIFSNTKLKLKPGALSVYFDNLFGDREDITRTTNEVINENINEVFEDLQDILEQTLIHFVEAIFNGVFKKFPHSELFV